MPTTDTHAAELSAGVRAPGTAAVPVPLTATVGREREIEQLRQLVLSTRLVTLTGAGGSGKTRLAIEAAARLAPAFPDGVAWIDLAPLRDAARVADHLAGVLCVREDHGCTSLDAVLAAIGARATLIILDNCEHLVQACAELAELIVRSCPGVHVLATSREALGISGETAWLVPPLSIPDESAARRSADPVIESESGRLFLDRARSVAPWFSITASNAAAVAHICRRLDGIPLAIELAAARAKVLTPEQIAERLDDSFRLLTGGGRTAIPRHRTLREAIDWSFALLSSREQCLLRRLSVFADTFSLGAVEHVCADGVLADDEILDALAALVDKSLVLMQTAGEEARYRLLETVRQYGKERLRDAGEEDLFRQRHAELYLALAEEAEPHVFGGASPWVARLDLDRANLRAAVEWADEDSSRIEITLRMLPALHWYWFATGRFHEGRQRLTSALGTPTRVPPIVRGKAANALASIVFWQGDHAAIRAPAEEAVAGVRDSGDHRAIAYALTSLGMATLLEGDPERAGPLFGDAVAVARNVGPSVLLSFTLYWQGIAAHARGDLSLAHASLDESTAIGRRVASGPATAHPLTMRARVALAERDFARAGRWLAEGLALHTASGDGFGTVVALDAAAGLASALGDPTLAARLIGSSEALRDQLRMILPESERGEHDRLVRSVSDALGASRFASERAVGRAMPLAETVAGTIDQLGRAGPSPQTADPSSSPAANEPDDSTTTSRFLRVVALGPLQIFRGDTLLEPNAWGSAKPRELLLFLLCHPDGCTKEQVGLAFWPEASSAQVRNSFHVTLHRLRKALGGAEWVMSAGDRYRVAPDVRLDFDAATFEREVPLAVRALKRQDPAAADRIDELLSLYRGDFLDGAGMGDWHLERRDRLQRLCADALLALGDWLASNDRHSDAAATFEKLVSRDDVHEEGYRRLMVSHARAGARPEALRAYQRLARVLADELETEPEPATTALYERLQGGERV
jgi:predicted ATPase/DNA-binding SARP family transcriptional activator